jgi:hypothetical protein
LKIILSKSTLKHIINRHPEVTAYADRIVEAVQNPDFIVKGLRNELKALKFYTDLRIGAKYLVVVYREIHEEKIIITAYFTSKVNKVRGEIVWRKHQ